MKRLINYESYLKLVEQYQKRENFEDFILEGCLLDSHILTADGCKTSIIKEVYLNEWSSAYSLTMYNKIPKKYQAVIDLLLDDESEKASKLFYKR